MLSERKLWEEISIYRDSTRDRLLKNNVLTLDNVSRCVTLFGYITEHLGVFKEIMNEIRVDLIESIFSHKLTAEKHVENSLIERVPYFQLYLQAENNQQQLSENCENVVENFEKKITKIEMEMRDAIECIKVKDAEHERLSTELLQHKEIIKDMEKDIQNLKEFNEELKKESSQLINEVGMKNENLKEKLSNQENITKDLQFYKEAHDHIDKTFMSACQDFEEISKEQKVDPFNKKNNLESEIKAILMMQQDINTLENCLLEDFDRRLVELKKLMLEQQIFKEDNSKIFEINQEKLDENMAKSIMEFNKAKMHFKNECMQVEFESLMLENHQMVLVNDLTVLHQAELEVNPKISNDHKEIRDSFVIDERLLSKYSAIIYISSDNGKTYYETKQTVFCESCGCKVVFCPHNIITNKVIKLPTGATHIKVQRPEIKINSKFARFMAPRSQYLNEDKIVNRKSSEDGKRVSSRKSQRSSIMSNESETALPFEVLLEDYENRTKISRITPRIFDEMKILSIFEDFWATILIEDEFDVHISETSTVYDKIYIFFLERYANERAAMLSLYDFFTSLIDASGYSQLIQLFCHILLVNIDSSVMRYLFHIVDCIDLIVWSGEKDLRIFIEAVYPFLNEDQIDTLVLSYISYSENVYNKMKIVEFILYNLIKQRDPRFIMIKEEASQFKTMLVGYYSLKEFQILLESLISLPNKKLSLRLFKELSLLYADEGDREIAPLSKITHIVSFLSFLEISDSAKQALKEKYPSQTKFQDSMRWGFTRMKIISRILQKDE